MSMVGIDLGTTNSCIAFHDGTKADIILTTEGGRTMPSVVALLEDGTELVGSHAMRQVQQFPLQTFQNFKRLMGQPWTEEDRGTLTVEGPDGLIWLKGHDRNYSPAEISGFVLQELLRAAEAYLGETPSGAVITVPANFDQTAREAVMKAAHFAGLHAENVHLLDEPVAAAIAYGADKQETFKTIVIYDFGGGTFDCSVLSVGQGLNDVIGKNGIARLGGRDFDDRIAAFAFNAFRKAHDFDISDRPYCRVRVMNAAREAKEQLSFSSDARIFCPMIASDATGATKDMDVRISRSEMEELCQDLIEQTIDGVQRALNDAQRSAQEIDEIVLVGGMTKMPAIKSAVQAMFTKKKIAQGISPDEVVALGAASFAAAKENRIGAIVTRNIVSHTIGFRVSGGGAHVLIAKNERLPCSKTVPVTVSRPDQGFVRVNILEGSNTRARYNRVIHRADVELDIDEEDGIPSGDLTAEMDEGGRLTVSIMSGGEMAILYDSKERGADI